MQKYWITFDLDGTLMQNPFVEWVFPEIVTTVLENTEKPLNVLDEIVGEHHRRMEGNHILAAYDWDHIVSQYLELHQISVEMNIEELVKKHSIHPKVYLLEDSVINVLTRLKEKGYLLAAATNGYLKYQAPVMDALGLSDHFDFVITPEMVGFAKPDVQMLEILKNKGKVVAHVGDRIDHDVKLAKNAGVPSFFIYRRLPDSLKGMHPNKRIQAPACLELLAEKWKRETKGRLGQLPKELIPDAVICSMDELDQCINGRIKR
ncbi:HAD superfamily hydrolase (TIGR01549 family) [Bacillus oleivorans]|uniref:HAD superfamily hydrolase (TIGR01549 family) n=1 Tax=Bacillus oleivorans TaxID=1448271 RepID=A0A285CNY1_9BACI|nr:HAD family hydrolase [Bacillus oleivorans]SNX68758.1 HAD superfamily hydrolase (TIGR01549 family) [Bacillus oleivorans]